MEAVISRLTGLNVDDAVFIVADCVDNGRLPVLIDYINAREALKPLEMEAMMN